MFEGVSKGKLFGWMLFFAFMTFSCFSVDTAITHVIGFIFLVVVVVLVLGIRAKFKRNATFRRLNRELAIGQSTAIVEPPTSADSSYFGPPPSLDR